MKQFQFASPNYTQTPNDLFDNLLKEIDDLSELKVTLAAVRMTVGYHKETAELSIEYLHQMTGLAKNSVRRGLALALRRGSIRIVRKSTNRTGGIYALNVGDSAVDTPEVQSLNPLNKTIKKESTSPAAANGKNPTPSTTPPIQDNPFKTWESVGMALSPYIAEQLGERSDDYSPIWVSEAIRRAARVNKRNLAYIDGILKDWQRKGGMDALPESKEAAPPVTEMPEYQRNIVWATS